jgi:alpha-beta hydrolase superfamily lysophospholipase
MMLTIDDVKGNTTVMRVSMSDRVDIVLRRVDPPRAPKAVAVVLHGTGLHGSYYLPFARLLANEGVQVAVMDQRGHGLSGGERGHISHPMQYADDLGCCFAALHQATKLPLFALAHSGAAPILLKALPGLAHDLLAGLALLAPTFANDHAMVRGKAAAKGYFEFFKYMLRPAAAARIEQGGDADVNTLRFACGAYLAKHLFGFGGRRPALTYYPGTNEEPYTYSAAAVAGSVIGQLERYLALITCPVFLATGDRDAFVNAAAVQATIPWGLSPDVRLSTLHLSEGDHFTTVIRSARHLGAWISVNVTPGDRQ